MTNHGNKTGQKVKNEAVIQTWNQHE